MADKTAKKPAQKPTLARGTRDFLPHEVLRRRFIFDTLRAVFELYGYQPIETPAMENLSVLEGKYGEEGDRLLFRILNSGDFLSEAPASIVAPGNAQQLLPYITEKALRYDLTVPFARFVVMHQNDLTFPFKRYQMQPVWRADRPQRGRYREFWQCDVDVVGSDSLLNEAEFIWIYDEALSRLDLTDFTIHINNRKILTGLAEAAGAPDKVVDICTAIDKLDKIGEDGVVKELQERGLGDASIGFLKPLFSLGGTQAQQLQVVQQLLATSATGQQGLAELQTVLELAAQSPLKRAKLQFNVTLARGLNYYTGAIFEVKSNQVQMGSIGGGGRYDNLTEHFGGRNLTGAGISFGADRIYDVMEELGLFDKVAASATRVLVINFGGALQEAALTLTQQLRAAGISAELYPVADKMGKQFGYADKKKIPFALIYGEAEQQAGHYVLKNMRSGQQQALPWAEVPAHVRA